jgi:hypothetical protein
MGSNGFLAYTLWVFYFETIFFNNIIEQITLIIFHCVLTTCDCQGQNNDMAWKRLKESTNKELGNCRNPTLAKCGGEVQHLEKLKVWSPPGLPNVQSSTARPKTPRIEAFLVSLKRSWNIDIENGLALTIRTSAAQVMGKRKAESQTGNLTPDH